MVEKYYYDLHIHSCLSPCGDDDMTPNNIAGMAALKGLSVIALCDHNTCKNCPAFFKACKKQGLVPIAGVEVTTSEDVHMICLFKTLDKAMAFDLELQKHRILIKNNEEVFGCQLIMDENDEIIGREEYLLVNATDLDVSSLVDLAASFDALVYPAHIDRDSNGIVSVLGTLPCDPDFSVYEFHFSEKISEYKSRFENLDKKQIVVSSDAHFLWDMNEAENAFELSIEKYSSDAVRDAVFRRLLGEKR